MIFAFLIVACWGDHIPVHHDRASSSPKKPFRSDNRDSLVAQAYMLLLTGLVHAHIRMCQEEVESNGP
jgi:hypothetical protein